MTSSLMQQTMRGPRWNRALSDPLFVLSLALQLLVVAGLVRAQTCPSVCSCSNQFSKVICTRRGLRDVPDGISTNTRYLNLQENLIQVIKVDSFKHLRHLEILQLSKNHIRNIEIGAFNGLANLNTLELFDNRLTTIPNGAFEYLSKLKELWLRNNPVESIPSYAFNRVPSLRRLDLGELKRLSYISEGAFEGLSNLRYLNLGMCNLKEIPNLIPLVRLDELEMSGNQLSIIRPGSFKGLVHLQKLWMMHAQIQTIERNAFDDLQSLVELNLAHNNLTLLPHDLFTPLHHLERVHLHHNPWNCNCDILWLSWWLKEMVPANTSCCARCSSPASHKGRYIGELDQNYFHCYAPVIVEPPADLNVTEGMAAELKCRVNSLTSVSWITPNGSIMTHGAYKVRISVLNDGTLNLPMSQCRTREHTLVWWATPQGTRQPRLRSTCPRQRTAVSVTSLQLLSRPQMRHMMRATQRYSRRVALLLLLGFGRPYHLPSPPLPRQHGHHCPPRPPTRPTPSQWQPWLMAPSTPWMRLWRPQRSSLVAL